MIKVYCYICKERWIKKNEVRLIVLKYFVVFFYYLLEYNGFWYDRKIKLIKFSDGKRYI